MLNITRPLELRLALAQALTNSSSTVELCWSMGQQAETLSTAFFMGYQAALRCLDPHLAPDCWASLAVSERGVKSPFQCQTQFDPVSGQLSGNKSHVLLAGQGLDQLYVLARMADSEPVQLVLVKLPAKQLKTITATGQPFLQDVPHFSVSFDQQLPVTAVVCLDAHEQANKPFRYWEDVHVALAMAGWLCTHLHYPSEQLSGAVERMMLVFKQHPKGYDLEALDAFDAMVGLLEREALELETCHRQSWQQDAVLLRLTAPIREKIRAKLQAIG